MFETQARCFLHRQGNFITAKGFFPDKVLTAMDNRGRRLRRSRRRPRAATSRCSAAATWPALFSNDNDATKKIMTFMTSKDFNGRPRRRANFISPHKTFDLSHYPNEVTKGVAELAYEATMFAFDGSDQMPGAVGSGSFWKQHDVLDQRPYDAGQALKAIDASWPAS